MFLAGIQKLTLLDYPGKVACTVFTAGCDLRCPFCHNASLALPERERDSMEQVRIPMSEVKNYIAERIKF